MPEVSVIIPTYNSARYLKDAVDSVLAQTFKDFEVLVIDDGSTDDTEAVMRNYGASVRYIRQENRGVSQARNRGIEESRGRWVAFLDADDTWYPHKLERQIEVLRNDSEARVCYSAFMIVTSDLAPIGINRSNRQQSTLEDLIMRGNVVGSICTVLAERRLFEVAGGFDPSLSQCADWDMWLRLAAHTEFLYIDEPLVTYRQHAMNMSRNALLLESDSLRVLEKAFAMPDFPRHLKRRRALARNHMVLAGTYFHAGLYSDFLRCVARSLMMDLRQTTYLLAYPARIINRLLQQDRATIT